MLYYRRVQPITRLYLREGEYMRTQLSSWQLKEQGGHQQMKYVELHYSSPAHLAGETISYPIDFPLNVEGINIKSIKAVSDENIEFSIALIDAVNHDIVYESLDEIKMHYDTIDLVYKSTNKRIIARFINKGALTTKFTVTIKGIEVK